MSVSPTEPHDGTDSDALRNTSYFPVIQSAKDRLLEQKRAEHEHARQEHRRRFEEQMQLLETKQQRDEAILTGVQEEDNSAMAHLPVTPRRTPAHGEARSRASTTTKGTPPLNVFETRHGLNEQLATPPSDSQIAASSAFGPTKSVPGSRRTSGSFGFEGLSMGDSAEQRRLSYIEQSKQNSQVETHRLGLPNIYSKDEGPTTSYLQMNTTDDSFPILVRRDSYAPGLTPNASVEGSKDGRRPTSKIVSPSNFSAFGAGKTPFSAAQPQRAMLEDLEIAQNRPMPEFCLPIGPPGQKPLALHHGSTLASSEKARRQYANPPSKVHSGIGPATHTPGLARPPTSVAGTFHPYGIVQQPVYQNYISYPPYGTTNEQEMQRISNPYNSMGRMLPYNKRSADDINRYADIALETLVGDIYSLCKDQHGCRYLQKKLDERNPASVDIIFAETYMHVAELMIDPFGNYLCQKLLEHCDDEKRLKVIQTVAPDLVNISLNMHGTRAVQKMIEYLTTSEQIKIATTAMDANAVTLIKDLNGNHVIQKCLNRLGSNESQFIFDAVSRHCVEVATHRHGCCVLQRCIDHASESQKMQVIAEINSNASLLVQDPFGNYVVQYVLDLGDPRFSDPLIHRFVGSVCLFSIQKFSSNVIEKCLRVAEPATRALLIEELLHKSRLEKLLRDSFANYVIQTALDYAEPLQRETLIECIRPLLPAIRATPYGRRIQSKISGGNAGPISASNFDYTSHVTGFPGYGFHMPSISAGPQNFTRPNTYSSSFKADYDF